MVDFKLELKDIGQPDVMVIFRYRGCEHHKETPVVIKTMLARSAQLVDQAMINMREGA